MVRLTSIKLVAGLLLLMAIAEQGLVTYEHIPAMDFYHVWGVAAANKLTDAETLGSPYTSPKKYEQVLNAAARDQGDPRLERANALRRVIEPTGTPLFYTVFAGLPGDYSNARVLFMVTQLLALLGGVTLLAGLMGLRRRDGLLIGLFCAVFFAPFLSDVRVGNVASLQLLWAVVMVWIISFAGTSGKASGIWLFVGLVAFALFKPNFFWIPVTLGLGFLVRAGWAWLSGAVLAGLVTCGLLVYLSSVYFDTPQVWVEWFRYVFGGESDMLVGFGFEHGNYSIPLLLVSKWEFGTPYWNLAGLAAVMGLSFLMVSAVLHRKLSERTAVQHLFADPMMVLSLGIVLALSASTLVWGHYYVIALIPGLWLLITSRMLATQLLAGLVLLSLSNPGLALLESISTAQTVELTVAFMWVPLWLALLLRLREDSPEGSPSL